MAKKNASEQAREGGALTPRQREILALVATGLTTADVAAQLGISPATVKTHLTMIYRVIGTRNRVQAARYHLDHLAVPPET